MDGATRVKRDQVAANTAKLEDGAAATTAQVTLGANAANKRQDTGPQGSTLWDLKGAGDCGFRAIAASEAERNKAAREDSSNKIEALTKSLKAKLIQYLRAKKGEWEPSWIPYPYATTITEVGAIPCDVAEWLRAVEERPAIWACPLTIQACARVQHVDILIFEPDGTEGKAVASIKAKSKYSNKFIAIALRGRHFVDIEISTYKQEWETLLASDSDDHSWHGRGAAPREEQEQFLRGGGKYVATQSSMRDLLRPASDSSAATLVLPTKATQSHDTVPATCGRHARN